MNEIQEILNSLSKEEQEAVIKILKQQVTGNADLLQELYSEDYEEIPVDIDTFLESPEYLGGSTDNGKAIYPYWRNAYREILEKKKVEMCFSGSIGSGKALSLDSKLVTPSGYIYMRDVKLGDKVAGEDGKFYDVTGVYPQGKQTCYRVYFSDRTHVDCTSEHLWTVIDKSGCRKTITTLEIINSKECYKLPNLTSAVEYNEFDARPQIRLIGSKIHILPHAEFLNKNIREDIMFAILGSRFTLVNDRTISIKKSILTSDSITTFSNICRSLGCIVSVHRKYIYIDVPPWLMSYTRRHTNDNADIRNKYITKIKKKGHKEFQCIEVSNPSKLYLTNNYTPTHNTTAAIYLMIYFFYRLMCLKNVRKFYGLEGNGPVCICFLNNTINLSKGVAYDKFMSTVSSSPWFLERGEVRGTVNIRYKPNKNIEFIIGSSADQIIGRDIFCLTGETQIHTENGYQFLEELEDKEVRVYTYDGNNEYLTNEPVKIKCTKFSNVTYVITLSDNTTIRCTWNHKFLTGMDSYTQAIDLEVGMKLETINSGVLYITDIVCVEYTHPIKLYDVINVEPYHNFVIKTATNAIISHNCAIIDELNFCISDKAMIMGNTGSCSVREFKDNYVFGYDAETQKITRGKHSGAIPTAKVDSYLRIELEDGTILECSHNHKFMLKDGSYKQAMYLTEEDELMEVPLYGYIYKTTCTCNNMKYIGQHKVSDKCNYYVGSNTHLLEHVKKFGKDNFTTEILAWASSEEELNSLEEKYICEYNATSRMDFYNKVATSLPDPSTLPDKYITVHKGDYFIRIDPEDVNFYINDGYSLGTGIVAINKDGAMQYINNQLLPKYEKLGWKRGNIANSNAYKGNVWVTDGKVDKHVSKQEAAVLLNEGYFPGRCSYYSKIFVHNTKKEFMINKEDIDDYIARGYKVGKLSSSGKGTVWVSKEGKLKRVPKSKLDSFLLDGWERSSNHAGRIYLKSRSLPPRHVKLEDAIKLVTSTDYRPSPGSSSERKLIEAGVKL